MMCSTSLIEGQPPTPERRLQLRPRRRMPGLVRLEAMLGARARPHGEGRPVEPSPPSRKEAGLQVVAECHVSGMELEGQEVR